MWCPRLLRKMKRKRKRSSQVIIYTMAGGGAHWCNNKAHYDDKGQQAEVYINDINGCHFQRGQVLFYYKDLSDQFRLEDRDFEADGWCLLEYCA